MPTALSAIQRLVGLGTTKRRIRRLSYLSLRKVGSRVRIDPVNGHSWKRVLRSRLVTANRVLRADHAPLGQRSDFGVQDLGGQIVEVDAGKATACFLTLPATPRDIGLGLSQRPVFLCRLSRPNGRRCLEQCLSGWSVILLWHSATSGRTLAGIDETQSQKVSFAQSPVSGRNCPLIRGWLLHVIDDK
jgi:hypothetical protein